MPDARSTDRRLRTRRALARVVRRRSGAGVRPARRKRAGRVTAGSVPGRRRAAVAGGAQGTGGPRAELLFRCAPAWRSHRVEMTRRAAAKRDQLLGEEPRHLIREHADVESFGVTPDDTGVERYVVGGTDRRGNRCRRLLPEERAGDALDNCLERSAGRERDHWPSAGLSFQRRQAVVLLLGKDKR